jgi:hypothetical protein
MIAVNIGFSVRVWKISGDPDNSVQTIDGLTPDVGEYAWNSVSGALFLCTNGNLGLQVWQAGTNAPLILSIVQKWRSQSSPTRSLNTIFQPSTTHDVLANYSVDVTTSLTLATGQSGTVIFEIASDSAFTLNVQSLCSYTNANTGTLAVGLGLTQIGTGNLTGYIPLGYYARLRTVNNTSTPTFTLKNTQEVLL